MKFRKDINGLRAIAVIAVVLFHFKEPWLPGGFVGVDIFFVISGFLMTGIIFRGIENDNFSFLKFYLARANRIIPALAVLCFSMIVFAWFYFAPHEFEKLSRHAVGSITFLSNIMYASEVGYFGTAAREKWLLHTWSLSVEWQFYIAYPLFLVLLKRYMSMGGLKIAVIAGVGIGFVFSVMAINNYLSDISAYGSK